MRKVSLIRCLIPLLVLAFQGIAQADATLDRVKSRGSVVVGVILSGPPFGYVDPNTQQPTGLNADLARSIADKLKLKLEFVTVTPPNRVQFLQQGKVDLLLANMQLTPERAELLGYVPTPYTEAGGGLITRKGSGVRKWEDLKGKVVCVSQGSNYAKPLTEQYGANVRALPGQPESLLALKGGSCFASVHDSAPLHLLVQDNPEWKDFELPISSDLTPLPSVIWIRKGEGDFQAALDKIVQDWYRTGWLLETLKKNRVPVTPEFLKWQAKLVGTK
ncbi:transporter substrate-binding domain-containing protein [Uliginosibacterium gangwonense]|uniref:transporter substrate-binding domain-containing protein n=1 Tax=Uliginosibacterium gangwonense TaxID=392736 RepID=UPI0003610A1A|nr:transporter substrate-binding domain-containing protein [Uliginosibacterium gangwonense]